MLHFALADKVVCLNDGWQNLDWCDGAWKFGKSKASKEESTIDGEP